MNGRPAVGSQRSRAAHRLAILGAAAAMAFASVPFANGVETAAPRRASASECAAWQARSHRLTLRLKALERSKLHGPRAHAASRLAGRLSAELGGYQSLLAVGCLPLPPLPAQPAGSGPVLSTIPAGLLTRLLAPLTFTPPQGAPTISQADAERIAVPGGIVRGSQLAHCFYSALPPGAPLPTLPPALGTTGPAQPVTVFTFDRDCWIVSLPGGLAVSSGPPPPPGAPPRRPAFLPYHVSLIDAQTGAFLMGIAG